MSCYSYVNACLMDWGQAVLKGMGEKAAPADPFADMQDDSWLDTVSAKAFSLACVALRYAEPVLGTKLTDTFSDSSAFHTWRTDVWRKNTQRYYDAFETCILHAMCTQEQQAIIDQFPAPRNPVKLQQELQDCRLRSGLLPDHIIPDMIDKVVEGRKSVTAAPKPA